MERLQTRMKDDVQKQMSWPEHNEQIFYLRHGFLPEKSDFTKENQYMREMRDLQTKKDNEKY